jgi:hypothetical protein
LQPPPRPQQAGLDRLLRNLQDLRGFLDAHSIDIAQHEDNPERLRQIRYGLLEKLGDLASGRIGFPR